MYQNKSNNGKGNTLIFFLHKSQGRWYKRSSIAEVVELVDTQDSGSCARKGVLVRVQSSAPLENPEKSDLVQKPLRNQGLFVCHLSSDVQFGIVISEFFGGIRNDRPGYRQKWIPSKRG
jgi:hypothetical protein